MSSSKKLPLKICSGNTLSKAFSIAAIVCGILFFRSRSKKYQKRLNAVQNEMDKMWAEKKSYHQKNDWLKQQQFRTKTDFICFSHFFGFEMALET